MSEMQTIQWFPGHMTKTRRAIAASLKQIDAVAEIVDARIPAASRNPDLAEMTGGKPRLILLNKCDMADPDATAAWVAYFKRQGVTALPVDCRSGKGIAAFVPAVKDLLGDLLARRQAKGMVGGTLRVMVAGIPNVGKSSFINRLAGSAKAKVEDRPGVTRGNQWFTVRGGVDLMDTPGVLWPKFDDQAVARRLAFTGAIRDEILDVEELAVAFLEALPAAAKPLLAARYKLPEGWETLPPYEVLEQIGLARGMKAARGAIDTERAAVTLLDEFRSAKLGRITLEYPERT
ncbi:MAG: ribosome biogenesis GTPase YlqF [Clostridia bacterium]|nr:ribosome biogenesis GTPase YlqF [Clostridia bacterium]